MAYRSYDATILAVLSNAEGRAHSLLLDIGEGRKARLPLGELRATTSGSRERALGVGSKLRVRTIYGSPSKGRLVVSERAEIFNLIVDRLTNKAGWRELCPEEYSWHFVKGPWECTVLWPTREIKFRKRTRGRQRVFDLSPDSSVCQPADCNLLTIAKGL